MNGATANKVQLWSIYETTSQISPVTNKLKKIKRHCFVGESIGKVLAIVRQSWEQTITSVRRQECIVKESFWLSWVSEAYTT